MLYEKNTFSAVIDVLDTNTASLRFSDRYIGFIDFASMVLWCLEVLLISILRRSYTFYLPPPKWHNTAFSLSMLYFQGI